MESISGFLDGFDIAKILPKIGNVISSVRFWMVLLMYAGPLVLLGFGLWYYLKPVKEPCSDKGFRIHEDGAAVHDLRHAGVGLHDDRKKSRRSETADEGQHPVGPESAVEARRVDAKPLEKRSDAFDAGASQELAVLAERDRRDDGKA